MPNPRGHGPLKGHGHTVAAKRPGKTGNPGLQPFPDGRLRKVRSPPEQAGLPTFGNPCRIDLDGKRFVGVPQPEPYDCAPRWAEA